MTEETGVASAPKAPPWRAEKIEHWPMASLVPYAQNARTHSPEQVEQLRLSMRAYGWTIPVLVGEDGEIIAGHGRVMAGSAEGYEDAPVIVATGWTEEQKRAYRIADNQLALNSDWNRELLGIELNWLAEEGADLDALGLRPADVQGLLAGVDARGGFLDGLIDPGAGKEPKAPKMPKGHVPLSFAMLPADRDTVLAWLNSVRDSRGLKTTAAALIALAGTQ